MIDTAERATKLVLVALGSGPLREGGVWHGEHKSNACEGSV